MIFILFVATAMAALTWLLGWWGVLVAALVIGFVFRAEGGGGWRIAVAAALAWAALLAIDAASGPIGLVGQRLGGVIRVPAVVLVLVTVLFPAMLAWSAATVVALALRQR
jgi:hypothetical protein